MLKQLVGYGSLLALFAGGFYAVNHSQDIIDWWRLRDYTPSVRIETIANAASLNDYGKKLFYVNDPIVLDDKAVFAESCQTSNEIIVLGCHITNQQIFLFDVKDDRLQGIVEVTAAHEMLHAAFSRLTLDEQDDLTTKLQAYYDELKQTNERLRQTIESYATRDTSIVGNELHSILGSEIRDLPRDLEEYYSQYFVNRSSVVTLAEAYEAEFIKRESQIKKYDAQLDSLNDDITRLEADILFQSQALKTEKQLLESLRANPDAYNAGVSPYNEKVNAYNVDARRLQELIVSYNNVVALRNEIALEERDLVKAIDSRVETL
jgi:cell division protein FtsB